MMAEKDSKPTPETGIEDLPEAEQPSSGPQKDKADARPAAKRRKKSRLRGWFWFLLLLLILLGLSLGWALAPQKVRMTLFQKVNNTFLTTRYGPDVRPGIQPHVAGMEPSQPASEPQPAPKAATSSPEAVSQDSQADTTPTEPKPAEVEAKPASEPQPQTDNASSEQEAAPAASPPQDRVAPATPEAAAPRSSLSPDQAAALLDEMHRLQGELASVQAAQDALHQKMQARARLELRTRLRWLASPDSRLAQQAALWGEIAVMPDLDTEQHSTAETMATQAQDDLRRLDGWRKTLVQLAGKLPEKQGPDILPKTENKYLAWLADAFHLRQAPDAAARQRAGLRQQVMDMERNLGAENWPDARNWRRLLGALRDQFGEKADLGLPESLQDIEQHLAGMRQKAADWLGSL